MIGNSGNSHWIIYWKDFWQDRNDYGRHEYGVIYHTRQQFFFRECQRGDVVWLVISKTSPSLAWKLAMKMIVSGKEHIQAPRPYRIIPDLGASQAYAIEGQRDMSGLLRQLDFYSGERIRAMAALIGRSFQTIRRLSESDGFFFPVMPKS